MMDYKLIFYSVKDALPVIPEGKFGVGVLVVTYDKVYDEICPGKGYDVQEVTYMKIDEIMLKRYPHYSRLNIKEDFQSLYFGDGWGEYGPVCDEVIFWAYMPTMESGRFI